MIVAFTGLKGSGKTLAARALQSLHFVNHSFAAPIKSAMRLFGLDDYDLSPSTKELPHPVLCMNSPRYAMQTLGTEWGRNMIGPDFWINVWDATRPRSCPLVVDDLRFLNEAAYLRTLGATIIRIVRPDADRSDEHPSEQEQRHIKVDDTLFNLGDERTFQIMVREAVERCSHS